MEELSHESTNGDPRDLQGRLTIREKEIVARLFGELRDTRRAKIYQAAQDHSVINPTDLTEEENLLVESIKHLTERTFSGSSKLEAEESLVVVRFLQDIPEIVGTDLRIYGPFKKEDVGSVPSTNAKALVGQGAAKVIEFKRAENNQEVVNNK